MIYSTYLSAIHQIPNTYILIRVARPSILGPSAELLVKWKHGEISWPEYDRQFRLKLLNDKDAYPYLHRIKDMGKTRDVVIYCYEGDPTNCHRTILMDILKRIGANVGGEWTRRNQC